MAVDICGSLFRGSRFKVQESRSKNQAHSSWLHVQIPRDFKFQESRFKSQGSRVKVQESRFKSQGS